MSWTTQRVVSSCLWRGRDTVLLRLLAVWLIFCGVLTEICIEEQYKSIILTESDFKDGYVVAPSLHKLGTPKLVWTDPASLDLDILSYNGMAFIVQNAFNIDRDFRTLGKEKVMFAYEIPCNELFTVQWTIEILNENDEAPEHVYGGASKTYHIVVNELTTPGRILPFTLTNKITDVDPNDRITYSMVPLPYLPCSHTTIAVASERLITSMHPSTANGYYPFRMISTEVEGDIQVNDTLDYETKQRSFLYKVTAEDLAGHTLTVSLIINIMDGNDLPPVFESPSYTLEIPENVAVGSRHETTPPISAFDQDLSIGDSPRYSILTDTVYFDIDESSGEIVVLTPLDRETREAYFLTIKVEERHASEMYATTSLKVKVTDVNDTPPEFIKSVYAVSIFEHSSTGSVVVDVAAMDRDENAYLTFSLKTYEDRFALEKTRPGTADVIVKDSDLLDRERQSRYILTVEVSDGVASNTISVYVTLLDINDNHPIFSQYVYTFSPANETSPPGHIIGQVTATDADVGDNSIIRYRIVELTSELDRLFSINAVNGVIRVAGSLSSNYLPFYELRVEAYNPGPIYRHTVASVRISVVDENTERPEFMRTHYPISVYENTAIGSTLLQLVATDEDGGTTLQYSMSSGWIFNTPPGNVFRVINSTGELLLQSEIDREKDERFKFQVTAFDGYYYTYPAATVEVTVLDINDNIPVFTGSYTFNVTEGCDAILIGQLHATDADTDVNADITYSVQEPGYYVEPNEGMLYITQCRDREQTSTITTTVYASDKGEEIQRTGSTTVTIIVVDVNDNKPMFTQSQHTLEFREGFRGNIDLPGVLDADLPVNGEYIISLTNADRDYFKMADGHIEILRPLDVPPGVAVQEYTIGLKVVNTAPYVGPPLPDSVTTLILKVTSVNIHVPQFTRETYSVQILENRELGSNLLTLSANDGDGDEIVFRFADRTSGEIHQMFSLDDVTGVISLNEQLDAEVASLAGPFLFQVVAVDPYGRSASATVNITVVDINDNAPIIEISSMSIDVSESRPSGYILPISVSVTDADSGRHGSVTCKVEPRTYLRMMDCNTIELVQKMDYEEMKVLEARVFATDNGLPSLSTSIRVVIRVVGENDNLPVFEHREYVFIVSENVQGRLAIGTVRATDADVDPIDYSLQPPSYRDMFYINPLGLLYAIRPLDRELAALHMLNVIASDGELTTAVRVAIHVLDQNDNPPIFRHDIGLYFIDENSPADNIFKVEASDNLDEGVNSEISYDILSGNSEEIFGINRETGVVGVARPYLLDYETRNEYKLTIQAKDKGYPAQYGTIAITIRVKDVNEFAPVFTEKKYSSTISENSPIGTLVAQVLAHDGDGNGRVTYSVSPESSFTVNSRGTIMVSKTLDGDMNPTRNITVTACDDYGLCSSTFLFVFLTDVNDNEPQFPQVGRQLNVTEDTPPGTMLLNMSALDLDRDDQLSYWVTGASDLFSVNSSTGVMYISGSPRASIQSVYHITVHVSDGPHTVHTLLEVHIHEANLHSPMFSRFAYHQTICETDNVEQVLMVFTVTDDDVGDDGLVDVNIISGDWNSSFAIRADELELNTFQLINTRPLEYAVKPYFELELEAADRARYPRYDHSRATIRLLSGSSSPPVLQSVVTGDITVSDEALKGDIVYTFVALVRTNEERESLRFSVTPEGSSYGVDSVTGHLVLTTDFPDQVTTLNVTACSTTSSECFGGLETKLCSSLLVVLNVKDEPQLPRFYPSSYYEGSVYENVGAESIVDIYANQSTGEEVNITILYNELYGELFSLVENTVWNTSPLDREHQDGYNLLVIAYGNAGVTTANVHIQVLDVNDEPPVFVFSEFREETTESQTFAGHVLTTVSVTDGDNAEENKRVSYSIRPSPHSHLFSLRPRGQQCDVILTDQLDADVPSNDSIATVIYSIQLRAYDPTNTSMHSDTTLQVLVRDDNDNTPQFTLSTYQFDTEEESTATSVTLGTVRAVDIDRVDIGKIRYSILEGSEFVALDAVYGQVSLNKPVDKETVSNLSFTVQATDSGGNIGSASLLINIIDRNDNKPEFLNTTFDFVVEEGPASLITRTLMVYDADYGNNSLLSFSKSGLNCDIFNMEGVRINEHSYLLVLDSSREMDREDLTVPHLIDGTAIYSCYITATDSGTVQLSQSKLVTFNVLDINDSPPRFTSPVFEWAVTEISPANFTIGQLAVTDLDFEEEYTRLEFTIVGENNGLFSLNKYNGEITLTDQPSLRTGSVGKHLLRVSVFDPDMTLTTKEEARVEIHILDSNDHSPVFSKPRYLFTISKKSQSDYVGKVLATDSDIDSRNAEIIYRLQFFDTKPLPFYIGEKSGIIYTSLMDFDTSATFLFGVIASDRGIPTQKGSAIIEVKIIAFSTSSYTGTIDEGAVLNSSVTITPPIYAVDTKSVLSIVYTLQPEDGYGIFAIQPNTGIVYVIAENSEAIDYETKTSYALQVIAGDEFGSGIGANLSITVVDVNDNPPVFSQHYYEFEVSEGSHNYILGRVTSSDVDTDSFTTYRIVGDAGPFIIHPDNGELRVTGGLDVEVHSVYYVKVEARDQLNTDLYDTAAVTIKVRDINDNSPVFTEDQYTWTVPEDVTVDTVVGMVQAADLENDTVVFSIENTIAEVPFRIHRLNGTIRVASPLDRERNSLYRFSIRAEDSGLANYTQVLVSVTDVNDNTPVFSDSHYYGSVTERSRVNLVVMVVFAADNDEMHTNNSEIVYSLEGSGSEFFDITENGVIKVSQEFTSFQLEQLSVYEADDPVIRLKVVARDRGFPSLHSSANVSLSVQSQHEDVPTFQLPLYSVEVKEDVTPSTKVATVTATVAEEDGVVLVYKLIGSHPAFTMMDSLSGDIYTQTILDRETQSYFIYRVEAVDNRVPRKTGYVTVAITIQDANDLSPQFDRKKLEFSKVEGSYNHSLLTRVQARDGDVGANAEITYSIISGSQANLFYINKTSGEVYLDGDLDYELAQSYHLTVEAMDGGAVGRTDTLGIDVYVLDVNDNYPVFDGEYGPYSVKENVHHVTIATVKAIDLDTGHNGEVYYTLVSGDVYGQFQLEMVNTTSVLKVRQFLDYEKVHQYNLTILAYDLGIPRRASQIAIQVIVEDVSDSKPVFQDPLYEVFIADNVTTGSLLLKLSAGYGAFQYSITGGNEYNNFAINSSTGNLYLNKQQSGGSDYLLIVQAQDYYTPPSIDTTSVKVIIEESDPIPRFARETYAAYIDENVDPGIEVIDLMSSDEQRNKLSQYKIIPIEGSEDHKSFDLNPFYGKLVSKVRFDREDKSLYNIKVQAFREYNTGSKESVSTNISHIKHKREISNNLDVTTVKVTIRDVNDNAPQFSTNELVGIPNNAKKGDTVARITATDPDAGENSTIAYDLTQSSPYFRIGRDTGEIILLVSSISLSQYELYVGAVDRNGHNTGLRSIRKFTLRVTDDQTRVSYQATIPVESLPSDVHLTGNLSKILGANVGVERTEKVSDTQSNITLYAFTDGDNLMSKSDLLQLLNDNQVELNDYFYNISNIITMTAKPIISSGGGGATDLAFIILGLVVGAAAIFGILLLTIYWRQRVTAEQKGEQGDLIEDVEHEEDDADSGVVELNTAAEGEQPAGEQMYEGMSMGMPNPTMFPMAGMMYMPGNSQTWMNPYQMQNLMNTKHNVQ